MGERKRKYKTEVILRDSEKCLIKLEKLCKKRGPEAETSRSLITWYLSRQYWTPKQWVLVKSLTANVKKPRKMKYYLYAISDGVNLKLGFSTDIEKRKRAIQTGNAGNIKTIWKYFVGYKIQIAKREEKRLHKMCKKHRIRGEWYKRDCLSLVEGYSPKLCPNTNNLN